MQLIAEAYDILKRGLGLHEDEIATIFEKWNTGVLDSFLIEITTNILKFKVCSQQCKHEQTLIDITGCRW
jgi:6-phosphogluconate dehydrogenase